MLYSNRDKMFYSNHTIDDFKNLPKHSLIYYYNTDGDKVYGFFVEIKPEDLKIPIWAYWQYYYNGEYRQPKIGTNLSWMPMNLTFIDSVVKEMKIIEDPQFKNMYI